MCVCVCVCECVCVCVYVMDDNFRMDASPPSKPDEEMPSVSSTILSGDAHCTTNLSPPHSALVICTAVSSGVKHKLDRANDNANPPKKSKLTGANKKLKDELRKDGEPWTAIPLVYKYSRDQLQQARTLLASLESLEQPSKDNLEEGQRLLKDFARGFEGTLDPYVKHILEMPYNEQVQSGFMCLFFCALYGLISQDLYPSQPLIPIYLY